MDTNTREYDVKDWEIMDYYLHLLKKLVDYPRFNLEDGISVARQTWLSAQEYLSYIRSFQALIFHAIGI